MTSESDQTGPEKNIEPWETNGIKFLKMKNNSTQLKSRKLKFESPKHDCNRFIKRNHNKSSLILYFKMANWSLEKINALVATSDSRAHFKSSHHNDQIINLIN